MTPANSTMTPRRFPLVILRSRLVGGMLFGLMLTGCATTQPTVSDAPPQDVQYALERGDCRA
ncbi:MAG: hypothetical protein R6U12_14800, partial [Thioalkalivibrio sp.]